MVTLESQVSKNYLFKRSKTQSTIIFTLIIIYVLLTDCIFIDDFFDDL